MNNQIEDVKAYKMISAISMIALAVIGYVSLDTLRYIQNQYEQITSQDAETISMLINK